MGCPWPLPTIQDVLGLAFVLVLVAVVGTFGYVLFLILRSWWRS